MSADRFIWRAGNLVAAGDAVMPPPMGGVTWAPDGAPVDLLLRIGSGPLHGIDVRVLSGRQPDAFTRSRSSADRARRWAVAHRATLHTLAIDERQLIANSGHVFYYRRGLLPDGATLGRMLRVRDRQHLLDLVALSPAAIGQLQEGL